MTKSQAGDDGTGPLSFERRLDWEVTTRCNLRCVHCVSRYYHAGIARELSEPEAHVVVDRCHEARIGAIHFFGGEPTLRPDLPAILKHCDQLGVTTTFNTNGTSLTDDLLGTLAGLRHRRPLLFSFEDVRPEASDAIRGPGSFGRALEGARRAREALRGQSFVVAFTLTRPAIETLSARDIVDFFAELGAGHVVFQDLAVPPSAPAELARLAYGGEQWLDFVSELFDPALQSPITFTYRLKPLVVEYLREHVGAELPLSYYGCNGLSAEYRLLPDGALLPCSAAVGWSEALELYTRRAPTLVERPLDDILSTEPYERFSRCKLERFVDPVMTPCRSCPHAFVRCNPCVFGRLVGVERSIQTCRWVWDAWGKRTCRSGAQSATASAATRRRRRR